MKLCEGCGEPDTEDDPLREYTDSGHYHDQCAHDCGVPESEMM